ncbi:MAG: hypothetical protein ACO3A2_06730 [Bdellovibrionia bacterium]
MRNKGVLVLLILAQAPSLAWASACCARAAAAPFLLLGEDQAQVSWGVSQSELVTRVRPDGRRISQRPGYVDRIQNSRLDVSFLLSDRWQMGLTLPWVRSSVERTTKWDSFSGLGDLKVSLGFEVLPLWSYSSWKPQGFLFTSVSLPTGRSAYESQSPVAADVAGTGVVSVAFGGLFLKRWHFWDAFLLQEVHYSFPRTQLMTDESMSFFPGWGGSLGLGAGYSPGGGNLRFGMRLMPRADQGVLRKVESAFGVNRTEDPWMVSVDWGVDASYLLGSSDTLMLSFTDQTLLGPAQNSNLSRMIALSYQHRWPR